MFVQNTNKNLKNILVCDDIPDNAYLIEAMLEQDYNIDICHSGEEALNKLKNQSYDLLNLNIILPDIRGDDLVKVIRNKFKINTPILFFTGVDETIIQNEYVLGVITKPIDFDVFLQQIKSILG